MVTVPSNRDIGGWHGLIDGGSAGLSTPSRSRVPMRGGGGGGTRREWAGVGGGRRRLRVGPGEDRLTGGRRRWWEFNRWRRWNGDVLAALAEVCERNIDVGFW